MSVRHPATPEVFTVQEIARAAGVATADVRALLDTGAAARVPGRFLPFEDASRVVRTLRDRAGARSEGQGLFAPPAHGARARGVPLAASGALHAGILAVLVMVAGLGVRTAPTEQPIRESARLVFLATPGPGGGGGGGGLRKALPPPKAAIRGTSKLKSPVTVTRKPERPEHVRRVETPPPPVPKPAPQPIAPPPAPPAPAPPVVAPVVSAPSDAADQAGIIADTTATAPSHGPGSGGGTGTGRGAGTGEGAGAGIGDGSTAGIGGGPYRPGSGITPPSLVREVKPIYTEEGRRRGVEGDVVMEVVVRADGSVGAIRTLRGLGSGLDQRAAEAIRQWKFSPARRFGTPVDVLVEIAVEFRLR